VVVTASTDKASYAAGEVVKVDVAAQNRSGHACAPVDPGANFQDPAGKGLGGVAVADMFTMPAPGEPPPRWDPGQTLATSFNWTPACPPTNSPASCAPGTYTVTASFGSLRSAPTAFKLV
jgi:hypothetical protein